MAGQLDEMLIAGLRADVRQIAAEAREAIAATVSANSGAIAVEQAKLDEAIARIEARLVAAVRETNNANAQAVRGASADLKKLLADHSAELAEWIELGRAGLPVLVAQDRRRRMIRLASWLGAGCAISFVAGWRLSGWIELNARGSAHPLLVMLGFSVFVILVCTALTWSFAAMLVPVQKEGQNKQ